MEKSNRKGGGGRTKLDPDVKLDHKFTLYTNTEDAKYIKRNSKYYKSESVFILKCVKNTELILPDVTNAKVLKELALLNKKLTSLENINSLNEKDSLIKEIREQLKTIDIINEKKIIQDILYHIKKIGTNLNQATKVSQHFKDKTNAELIRKDIQQCRNQLTYVKNIIEKNERSNTKA